METGEEIRFGLFHELNDIIVVINMVGPAVEGSDVFGDAGQEPPGAVLGWG